ncbi:GGDEF domain-containing protein [Nitratireductor sp. ZSWI3]|uniref:GGDEF domain-containing protein n=1 Tax=Nitratireductor sp. ZSWI3 TaxID=2966359 RepID=UPI0021501771|nr:GGDEF domain-containing protein [Nitratireductor sp. ZSWI3]MCR4269077.1 GGDEF domain-containing protein [Nitratireductor sp. ZSWI3]
MWKIVFNAALLTLGVILVGQLISLSVRWLYDEPFTGFVMLMNSVLPLCTAFPAGLYIFWQNDRLRGALTALEEAHRRLEQRATHDQMTGFLNREAFFERLKTVRRKTDSGALLLIDADHFKSVNDTYGHQTGDRALKLIADAIQHAVRAQDMTGRIGGEEFCAFLPAATRDEAILIAERLRAAVERILFEPRPGERRLLSVSLGIAMADGERTASQLMREADLCLYEAKRRGRNRVVSARPKKLVA